MRKTLKKDKRPLAERQFLYTQKECALVAGVGLRCWWRYPNRPRPPTTKTAVGAFMQRNRLPGMFGQKPSTGVDVYALVTESGYTISQAARYLNISKQVACTAYHRHVKRRKLYQERGYIVDQPDPKKENNSR